MSKDMWEAVEDLQKYADAFGIGGEWFAMTVERDTSERTAGATYAVRKSHEADQARQAAKDVGAFKLATIALLVAKSIAATDVTKRESYSARVVRYASDYDSTTDA